MHVPVLAFLLASGCAAGLDGRASLDPDGSIDLGAAWRFAEPTYLVQHVQYRSRRGDLEFTAMVEVGPDSLSVAALSPLGTRLFALRATRGRVHYDEQPLFDAPFSPEELLRDFALFYAPCSALRAATSDIRWHACTDTLRRFSSDGVAVTVRLDAAAPWSSGVLTRSDGAYELHVATAEAGELSQ